MGTRSVELWASNMNPKIKRARQGSNPNLALTSSTKVQLNKEAHTMLTKTKQFTNTLGRNIDSLPFHVQQLISAISSLKYAAGLTGHIEAERFSRQAVYAPLFHTLFMKRKSPRNIYSSIVTISHWV